MPHFYVAINRNDVEAIDAADAANKAVTTPLGAGDTSYVKELQSSGSLFTIPGMRTTGIVGTVPTPDLVVTGGAAANTVLPPPPPMPEMVPPEIPPFR
jgi:hypothetical protein